MPVAMESRDGRATIMAKFSLKRINYFVVGTLRRRFQEIHAAKTLSDSIDRSIDRTEGRNSDDVHRGFVSRETSSSKRSRGESVDGDAIVSRGSREREREGGDGEFERGGGSKRGIVQSMYTEFVSCVHTIGAADGRLVRQASFSSRFGATSPRSVFAASVITIIQGHAYRARLSRSNHSNLDMGHLSIREARETSNGSLDDECRSVRREERFPAVERKNRMVFGEHACVCVCLAARKRIIPRSAESRSPGTAE